MDLTFTGRGLPVTDEVRETAGHKLAHLSPEGVKRVEAALYIPRKTFRARAEAEDVPTAIDRVADKLERQLRDHHGKRRASLHKPPLESAHSSEATADIEAEGTEGEA